jgi:hypothetical protein
LSALRQLLLLKDAHAKLSEEYLGRSEKLRDEIYPWKIGLALSSWMAYDNDWPDEMIRSISDPYPRPTGDPKDRKRFKQRFSQLRAELMAIKSELQQKWTDILCLRAEDPDSEERLKIAIDAVFKGKVPQ